MEDVKIVNVNILPNQETKHSLIWPELRISLLLRYGMIGKDKSAIPCKKVGSATLYDGKS